MQLFWEMKDEMLIRNRMRSNICMEEFDEYLTQISIIDGLLLRTCDKIMLQIVLRVNNALVI